MLCANALPAAGYKAWVHRCACIAVEVHTWYNPWGYIVCAEQSMDVSIHALRTVQSMDCMRNPQIIVQIVDPYIVQDNLRIVPIHTLCIYVHVSQYRIHM